VVATFSEKKIFGYVSMVAATASITLFSFLVWLHHFFTMGAGANVNAVFGIATMIIAIPTGVKIFNWLFTMYKGRVHFTTPMLWFFGFVATFTLGGMAGVLMAIPGADFELHNSLFLVAHFHTMIVGGVLFGLFAGFTYWFPKFTGFKLNERLGRYAFWCWIVGFFVAFIPLYILGFMGATRRLDHYDPSTGWQGLFIVAGVGVVLIACGVLFQILQVIVSLRQREKNIDTTNGDPWNGRTLEWATHTPVPAYNFAVIPEVYGRDAFYEAKKTGRSVFPSRDGKPAYEDIIMPKNTAIGLFIGIFGFLVGFAVIWHIIWLIIMSFVAIVVCLIVRSCDDDTEYVITPMEVEKIENSYAKR
jgi:cytochrome o ubiquinol oxidase subunit 1